MRATALLALAALLLPHTASGAPCRESTPYLPAIALKEVVRGLANPVAIASPPGDSKRLFVVEQRGTIRIVDDGKLQNEFFLDLRDIVESGGEKGLLGVAFHPRYDDNGLFFVNYTTGQGGLQTVVSRFRAKGDRADRNSETVLLRFKQPFSNHNGGQVAFGPDGFLYVATGDGGSANDPHGNGQRLDTLLGKILRIDIDRAANGKPYAIPRDNPFVNKNDVLPEIFAYGLRNPWRFSFDALTGRLYAADVGQNAVEEVNIIEPGGNYGWNIMEGDICTPAVNERCDIRGLIPPIATYRHPDGFSITGGFVYRGNAFPALCGVYLYADYVTKRIWGLRYDGTKVTASKELLRTRHSIATFGEDDARELYLADHESGAIFRVVIAR